MAYIAHGLISLPLDKVIDEIKSFKDEHPKEIILVAPTLLFEYKQSLSKSDRVARMNDVLNQFSQALPRSVIGVGSTATLKELWDKSIGIVLLRENLDYTNKWFEATSADKLYHSADSFLNDTDGRQLTVLDLILTPDGSTIAQLHRCEAGHPSGPCCLKCVCIGL